MNRIGQVEPPALFRREMPGRASGMASRAGKAAVEPNRGLVVLAVRETTGREDALAAASLLARVFEAEIKVLRVESAAKGPACDATHSRAGDSFFALRWMRTLAMRTWQWCKRRLPGPISYADVTVREGEFGAVAARTVLDMRPNLLVVPGIDALKGAEIVKLVEETKVPILVAHSALAGEAIVAATDLSLERAPVLRFAANLGGRLGWCVIFMHNVEFPTDTAETNPSAERFRSRASLLKSHADALGPDIECVVTRSVDTPGAIICAARMAKAEILVVGINHRTSVDEMDGAGVAAQVVERSSGSVLVVPLGDK
jgi:nucleotide-binding universal stress UspA family protein